MLKDEWSAAAAAAAASADPAAASRAAQKFEELEHARQRLWQVMKRKEASSEELHRRIDTYMTVDDEFHAHLPAGFLASLSRS